MATITFGRWEPPADEVELTHWREVERLASELPADWTITCGLGRSGFFDVVIQTGGMEVRGTEVPGGSFVIGRWGDVARYLEKQLRLLP
jgi:hypothetical protein